jgi:hypothetical protein
MSVTSRPGRRIAARSMLAAARRAASAQQVGELIRLTQQSAVG